MRPLRHASLAAVAALAVGCTAAPQGGAPASKAAKAPANALTVRIAYGSEKKAWLTDSIEAFHRTQPKTAAGRPIRIEALAEGSAESMESILAGRNDIAVWSPASSLLVDVLNDRWAEGKGVGSGKPIVESATPLVLSPVVIAMWEPMARALGWPDKPLGWAEVAGFATSGETWGRHGHPEWGAFKFGHTHPGYSNSGAVALVAAAYAGAGKTRDLKPEDVSKAAPFLRKVQANVVHYGRSTGFFAEKMYTRGPGYLSAAVLYENLVVESYLDPQYRNKPFPVVAVYPREGTFWCDHPYAILQLPSVTPEVREAAESFKAFLLSGERQRAALQRFGFRPADPQIPLGPPLDTAHGVDPAQPKNVLENPKVAVTRKILDSFESVKRPVAVTFVIDTSGSMNGEPLARAKAGARVFMEGLPAGDTVRLLFFSSSPRWVSESPEAVGVARPRLVSAIDSAFADGGTALYDSILEALKPPPGIPAGAAQAVIVLTDGQDTDSHSKLPELLGRLGQKGGEEASAPRIFAIAYGDKADPGVLKQIAEAGGGAFFSGTPKDIQKVYAELATFF
jgi:Ca-activated chloride channel family protein